MLYPTVSTRLQAKPRFDPVEQGLKPQSFKPTQAALKRRSSTVVQTISNLFNKPLTAFAARADDLQSILRIR
jgi:hypothetical protein